MNSMTSAPTRPLTAPLSDLLNATTALVGFVARGFAPRRSDSIRPSWRQRAFDAAQVRRMAMALQHIDPGMTADLLAAADRHQGDAA